jgi:predicted DNA-binding protein
MTAKKLVSMRINEITDEKLTDLAEEIGETKANLISMAVNQLYDKYQEEKRMKEIALYAESFLEKNFASLSQKDRSFAATIVSSIRLIIDDMMDAHFETYDDSSPYGYVPDVILTPIKKTFSEFLEALETKLSSQ